VAVNVGIGLIDFQGLWEGRENSIIVFRAFHKPSFPQACFNNRQTSGYGLRRQHLSSLARIASADVVQRRVHAVFGYTRAACQGFILAWRMVLKLLAM